MIDDKVAAPFELTLSRPADPPDRIMTTLPGPISMDESRSLARRVLGPYLKQVLVKGDDAAKSWTLGVLRWLDPPALLEHIQKTHFDRVSTADHLRSQAALGFVADDPDEAAAIAETIVEPADRTGTLIDLVDLTPAADRARKLALLDRAALQVRGASLSSNKLFQMGEVAERWLELGEMDKSRALFAEGRKLVETMPPQKRTDAGSFQAHLSRVDPAAGAIPDQGRGPDAMAATDLREHRDPAGLRTSGRGRGRAQSTRRADLADLMEHRGSVDGSSAMTWRGRGGSPPRFRTHPSAYAWTFLADGLSTSDRTAASAALDQALREIDSIDHRDLSHLYGPNPAASILPLVEQIAPERVAEFFWRAVALHSPLDDPRTDFGRDEPLAAEALLLSRYDRDVAEVLFEPVAAFVRSRSLRDGNDIIPVVIQSFAVIDPRTAVEVVEGLPPGPDPRRQRSDQLVADHRRREPRDAALAALDADLAVPLRLRHRHVRGRLSRSVMTPRIVDANPGHGPKIPRSRS